MKIDVLYPPIPGLDGDNVVIVNNCYLEKDKVDEGGVVFGDGLAGCECVIHLGTEGKKVHLVEMRDVLAPDAVPFVRVIGDAAKVSTITNTVYWG